MPVTPSDLASLTTIMRAAATARILPRFRNLETDDVSTKSGPADLVTLADVEAEADMTAALRLAMPGTLVVGEEAVAADPRLLDGLADADRAVILDPVDGTWNFAKGLSLFGMIAAVTEKGQPVAGVLLDPLLDDWIIATSDGPARLVRHDGRSVDLQTSKAIHMDQMVGYVPMSHLPRTARSKVAAQFSDLGRLTSLGCSCHEYRMLAQGHADFCLSGPKPQPWDHVAGSLIVTRAGGTSRMLDGRSYDASVNEGYLLTASSETVWEVVAERLSFLIQDD